MAYCPLAPQVVKRFLEVIRFNQAYRILDANPDMNGSADWGAGACWLLARTLQEFWGRGELFAVVRIRNRAEHVVYKLEPDVYLDGYGCRSAKEVREWMEREANWPTGSARIRPLEDCDTGDIAGSRGTDEQVRALLSLFCHHGWPSKDAWRERCPR